MESYFSVGNLPNLTNYTREIPWDNIIQQANNTINNNNTNDLNNNSINNSNPINNNNDNLSINEDIKHNNSCNIKSKGLKRLFKRNNELNDANTHIPTPKIIVNNFNTTTNNYTTNVSIPDTSSIISENNDFNTINIEKTKSNNNKNNYNYIKDSVIKGDNISENDADIDSSSDKDDSDTSSNNSTSSCTSYDEQFHRLFKLDPSNIIYEKRNRRKVDYNENKPILMIPRINNELNQPNKGKRVRPDKPISNDKSRAHINKNILKFEKVRDREINKDDADEVAFPNADGTLAFNPDSISDISDIFKVNNTEYASSENRDVQVALKLQRAYDIDAASRPEQMLLTQTGELDNKWDRYSSTSDSKQSMNNSNNNNARFDIDDKRSLSILVNGIMTDLMPEYSDWTEDENCPHMSYSGYIELSKCSGLDTETQLIISNCKANNRGDEYDKNNGNILKLHNEHHIDINVSLLQRNDKKYGRMENKLVAKRKFDCGDIIGLFGGVLTEQYKIINDADNDRSESERIIIPRSLMKKLYNYQGNENLVLDFNESHNVMKYW
jgi:hypothetical protein